MGNNWATLQHSGRSAVQFPWLRGDGRSVCAGLRLFHVVLSALHLHEPARHRTLRDVQPAPELGSAPSLPQTQKPRPFPRQPPAMTSLPVSSTISYARTGRCSRNQFKAVSFSVFRFTIKHTAQLFSRKTFCIMKIKALFGQESLAHFLKLWPNEILQLPVTFFATSYNPFAHSSRSQTHFSPLYAVFNYFTKICKRNALCFKFQLLASLNSCLEKQSGRRELPETITMWCKTPQ